ncbi:hypothetical protein BVC80_1173g5 [Macleaya cordata]|uniref:Uncharacterized protein n=1 Tax=Macleaya cordata TaxID=56857 RepID=A0A200QIG4_MACCD|nr:hypothetical protein BVC80_1173g5 [Macleaya cordata]
MGNGGGRGGGDGGDSGGGGFYCFFDLRIAEINGSLKKSMVLRKNSRVSFATNNQ